MSGKHKLNDSPGLTTEAKKGKTDSSNVGENKATPSPSNLKVYPRRSRTPSAKAVDIMIDESIEKDRLANSKTPPNKPKTTPKRTQSKKTSAAMRNKALIDNNISPVTVQLSPLKKSVPLTPEEKKNKPASSLLDFKRPIVSKKSPAPLTPEKIKDGNKETVKEKEMDKGSNTTEKQSSDQLPSLGTISQKSSENSQTESSDVTSVLSITDKLPSLRPITMANDLKCSQLVADVDVPPGSTQQKNIADINEAQTATVIDMTQNTNNVELLSTPSNVEQQLQNIPMLENGSNIHVISDKIILAADLGDGSGTNYLITIDPATQAILERDGKLVVVSKVVENDDTKNGTSVNASSEPTSTQDTVQEPDSSTKIVIISNETTDAGNSENQTKNLTDSSSINSSYISPTTIPSGLSNEIGVGKPDTTTKILHESDSTTTSGCTSSSDTVSGSIDQPKETRISVSTVDKSSNEWTAPDIIPSSQTTNETSIEVIPEKSYTLIQTSHESSETISQEPDTTTTSNSSTETNTEQVHTSNIAPPNPPLNVKNVEADSSTKVESITKEAIVTPPSEKNFQIPDTNTSSALKTDKDLSKLSTQTEPTEISDGKMEVDLPGKPIVSTTDSSTPKQQINIPTSDDNIIHLGSELICLPDEDDSGVTGTRKQGNLAISGTNTDDPAILVSEKGEAALVSKVGEEPTGLVSKTGHASAVSASENGDSTSNTTGNSQKNIEKSTADITGNSQKNSDKNSALAVEKNGQMNVRKEQGIVIPTEIDLFGDKSNSGDSDNNELKNSLVQGEVPASVSSKLSENTVSSNEIKDG